MIELKYIETSNHTYAYNKLGDGKNKIIFFHGFLHETNKIITSFEILKNDFTIFIVHLPFHGETKINDKKISNLETKDFYTQLISRENITTCVCMGYSLGARLASEFLFYNFKIISKFVLLAPQGILKDYYLMWVKKQPLKSLLKYWVKNPKLIYKIARYLDNIKLLKPKHFQLLTQYQKNIDTRKMAYNSWIYTSTLGVDLKNIESICLEHKISMIFIIGKFDKIFPIEKFEKQISIVKQKKIVVLEAGHQLLSKDSLNKIKIEII